MYKILLIVGGSGSGKSTLESELCTKYSDKYKKCISATTRKPRVGEIDGVDYHFIDTEDEFNKLDLLEKVRFGDNLYGMTKSELSEDKITVIVAKPNGILQIIEYCKNNGIIPPYLVYLDIDIKIRRDRMLNSRNDSIEFVNKRLPSERITEEMKSFRKTHRLKPNFTLKSQYSMDLLAKDIYTDMSRHFSNFKSK